MKKEEMKRLLIDEYGYGEKELKDDNGGELTNKVLQKMIDEEQKKDEDDNAEVKEEQKQSLLQQEQTVFEQKEIKDDDLILCMSGVNGELIFSSPLTNFTIRATKFGQPLKIRYKDLSYVHANSQSAFESGKIIVLNEQVAEEFGYKDMYENIVKAKDVKNILNLPADELGDFIDELPKATRNVLFDEARKAYNSNQLDSMSTIRVIEEKFGVSLEDNSPDSDVVK